MVEVNEYAADFVAVPRARRRNSYGFRPSNRLLATSGWQQTYQHECFTQLSSPTGATTIWRRIPRQTRRVSFFESSPPFWSRSTPSGKMRTPLALILSLASSIRAQPIEFDPMSKPSVVPAIAVCFRRRAEKPIDSGGSLPQNVASVTNLSPRILFATRRNIRRHRSTVQPAGTSKGRLFFLRIEGDFLGNKWPGWRSITFCSSAPIGVTSGGARCGIFENLVACWPAKSRRRAADVHKTA